MTDVASLSGSHPPRGAARRFWRSALATLPWLALAIAAAAHGAPPAAARDTVHPAEWPAMRPAVTPDARAEAFVERVLQSLTLEEKVGQLVQADIASVTPEDVRTYRLGSILAGGNAAPGGDVRAPAAHWLALADRFFRASLADPPAAHPPIPVLFGIDAVHGHARIPGATVFPHNVGLGAAHDAALVEQIGEVTAAEVAATGLDWTFAPTVAVVRDVRWGRSYESYSEDPALVAAYASAMVSGLQGRLGTAQFMGPGRTLASVKHYLGDGGTRDGRDQFDNLADERTLRDVDGAGYPAAIGAGALIVMASYNGWHGTKMHANRPLLTEVLKGRWAFPGFVVGDWNAQEEVPGCTKYACAAVLEAGLDMYMAPDSWKPLYANLLAEARSGRIAAARIDDAVRRILRVKVLAGLFDKRPPADRPEAAGLAQIGSAAHRALARQAVRESLVLLKNTGHLLPLDPHARILVTGAGADDIGMQCGGWTIDWQGDHNSNADFPGGTSILAGIRAAVTAAGGSVVTSLATNPADRPAAAIVVYGETPYAEFEGDRETLEFASADAPHLATLRQLRAAGIPVVSVFLSGRPMWVNRELNASDAFVAAWLPGSEGAGVADLLFRPQTGAPRDFTGRLAFSWPATAMPVRFGPAGVVRGALFARGYGLNFAAPGTVARVSEDAGTPQAVASRDTLFRAGHVTAPWSVYVGDATADVRLTMDAQASPTGAVTARLAGTGLQVQWSGRASGEVRIGGRAADLRRLAADGGALVLRYRVDGPARAAVGLGLRCEAPYGLHAAPEPDWRLCGTGAGALLDVSSAFRGAGPRRSQTLTVPLSCLRDLGADLSTVSAPLAIETSGRLDVQFEEIRLVRGTAPSQCPPRRG